MCSPSCAATCTGRPRPLRRRAPLHSSRRLAGRARACAGVRRSEPGRDRPRGGGVTPPLLLPLPGSEPIAGALAGHLGAEVGRSTVGAFRTERRTSASRRRRMAARRPSCARCTGLTTTCSAALPGSDGARARSAPRRSRGAVPGVHAAGGGGASARDRRGHGARRARCVSTPSRRSTRHQMEASPTDGRAGVAPSYGAGHPSHRPAQIGSTPGRHGGIQTSRTPPPPRSARTRTRGTEK